MPLEEFTLGKIGGFAWWKNEGRFAVWTVDLKRARDLKYVLCPLSGDCWIPTFLAQLAPVRELPTQLSTRPRTKHDGGPSLRPLRRVSIPLLLQILILFAPFSNLFNYFLPTDESFLLKDLYLRSREESFQLRFSLSVLEDNVSEFIYSRSGLVYILDILLSVTEHPL